MAIDITSSRVEGSALVVGARFAINMTSLTLEQHEARRKTLVTNTYEQVMSELPRSPVLAAATAEFADEVIALVRLAMREHGILEHEPEWYNDEANLSMAMDSAIKLPAAVVAGMTPRVMQKGHDQARKPTAEDSPIGGVVATSRLSSPGLSSLGGGEADLLLEAVEHASRPCAAIFRW